MGDFPIKIEIQTLSAFSKDCPRLILGTIFTLRCILSILVKEYGDIFFWDVLLLLLLVIASVAGVSLRFLIIQIISVNILQWNDRWTRQSPIIRSSSLSIDINVAFSTVSSSVFLLGRSLEFFLPMVQVDGGGGLHRHVLFGSVLQFNCKFVIL